MADCIYCGSLAESLEHPLPAAFGEFEHAPLLQDLICGRCNNALGLNDEQFSRCGAEGLLRRYFKIQGRERDEKVGLVPQTLVGTDPGQFEDLRPYVITGELSPQLPPPNRGAKYISTGVLYNILQQQILSKPLLPLNLTEVEAADLHGYREFPLPSPPIRVYKAAPRDGVWATAPFLHNGSVPNLYEMLLPAKERTKKFYIGREFDPVKVGLDTNVKSGTFLLDTSLPGNSNAGHSFENAPLGNGVVGPLLTEEQRWTIVEYLKSIPEDAGRVTPFGGSPK